VKIKGLLILLLLGFTQIAHSQRYIRDSIASVTGQLIHQDKNVLMYADSSANWAGFLGQLDSIYTGKPVGLHIFHIGGSHIQADLYSDKLRCYLQNMNENAAAQRGFVFPYKLAATNNPLNYRITANLKKWKGYRSSVKQDLSLWGLSGITAELTDSIDTLNIQANYKTAAKMPYSFSRIRFFTDAEPGTFTIQCADSGLFLLPVKFDSVACYAEYRLPCEVNSARFSIRKLTAGRAFRLMGFELMNARKGIEYTSIGVNGAGFYSYQRCTLFENQLQLYRPDLFIISIGTNDAYTPQFDSAAFRKNYENMADLVLKINPECALLFTVPNDNYYKRKYPNKNTALQQKIIHDLARKYHAAVWDFYAVMGGLGSSQRWYLQHLMARDRVHFTRTGYSLKADLLFKALVNAWEKSSGRPTGSLLNQLLLQHE